MVNNHGGVKESEVTSYKELNFKHLEAPYFQKSNSEKKGTEAPLSSYKQHKQSSVILLITVN